MSLVRVTQIFPTKNPKGSNEMGTAFQKAVYHKATPKEALDEAAARLNKGLEEAWRQVVVE